MTCHDGFTLHDLVSYDRKHNEANGEENRDGSDDNISWNCGVEGETSDPSVLALRRRQARNHLAILMLSRGVPMILAGDEVLRSQGGNNNAYCQDNALSWFDWALTERNRDMLRFVRELIALRRRHPCLTANRFFTGAPVPGRGLPDISWHGIAARGAAVARRRPDDFCASRWPASSPAKRTCTRSSTCRTRPSRSPCPRSPRGAGTWLSTLRASRRPTSSRAIGRSRIRAPHTRYPHAASPSLRQEPWNDRRWPPAPDARQSATESNSSRKTVALR